MIALLLVYLHKALVLEAKALYARFEAFLESFKSILMETKESDFEEIKKAHIANYLTKPSNLSGEFSYLTNEWSDNKKEIDTKLKYVAALESVTLEQVQKTYMDLFFNQEKIQQIIVQVKGKKFNKEEALTLPKQVTILSIDQLQAN